MYDIMYDVIIAHEYYSDDVAEFWMLSNVWQEDACACLVKLI